jgi:hypothetical protein
MWRKHWLHIVWVGHRKHMAMYIYLLRGACWIVSSWFIKHRIHLQWGISLVNKLCSFSIQVCNSCFIRLPSGGFVCRCRNIQHTDGPMDHKTAYYWLTPQKSKRLISICEIVPCLDLCIMCPTWRVQTLSWAPFVVTYACSCNSSPQYRLNRFNPIL